MQTTVSYDPSSYRDPSGFIFTKDNTVYRQVNKVFKEQFNHFIESGCCEYLQRNRLLVRHEQVSENLLNSSDFYTILKPEKIHVISYPYEWSFDMLKDAALLTLQLVNDCLPFGTILKDATPYNIQWHQGKPIFIDSLSFEKYDPSTPWIAYRQFCESFLSPLLLMHYTGRPLQTLLLAYPDGIPLPITKSLLPAKSRLSLDTYLHIHLHENLSRQERKKNSSQQQNFSRKKLQRLVDSLQSLTNSLKWKGKPSTWENYYSEASQAGDYFQQKENVIESWLKELGDISTALDLGANQGKFSHLLARKSIRVIATDFDHNAINNLYKQIKEDNEKNILPLVIDVANPSPSIGLNNSERPSFIERTKVDLCLALALVHHLSIGKNIPFGKIAELLKTITDYLVIEFVPKEDEKVKRMLTQKRDIYYNYNEGNFTQEFEKHFSIEKQQEIGGSGRILYQMRKRPV